MQQSWERFGQPNGGGVINSRESLFKPYSEINCGSSLSAQVGGNHYKGMEIQPVEFIYKNEIPYLEGSAIKYICRHRLKGGVKDIDKAIHFLEILKELEYKEEDQDG